jgi:uncharacterized protein (DUF433 family)
MQEYVEKRGEGYYFAGSRVSLESVVFEFLKGESPESNVEAFPSLSLEQVYGGITFYLAHRVDLDAYLRTSKESCKELSRIARQSSPLLYKKLDAAKKTIV